MADHGTKFTRGEEIDLSFSPAFDAIAALSQRKGLVETISAP